MPKRDLLRFLFRGFRGFGLRLVKSVMKLAIGRKPHFYAQDLFFLAYLRHLLGLSQMCISSKPVDYSSEGGGSHALLTMAVIDFARTLGLDYVHTPFIEIHHADRPRKVWLAAWEGLFNFGAGEVQAHHADRDVFSITPINFDPIRSLFGDLRPYNEHDTHVVPQFSPEVVGEFRRKYYSNKSSRRNARLTVCVHIRRFNAGDDNISYVASFSRMGRTLADVRAVLAEQRIDHVIRIFSQGHLSEFPENLLAGAELLLDGDPIRSLEELIEADVLLSSRGSFSYVAGVLCDGIVICEPFYPPQRDWLVCDADGPFDADAFTRRLRQTATRASGSASPATSTLV